MKLKKAAALAASAVLAFGLFCFWQNNGLAVSRFFIEDRGIPEEFDRYTIVQISDLHNKNFGKQQERILSKIADENPDVIVITGDMADSRRTDVETALVLARQAARMAPCYYVPGNHESRMPEEYSRLKAGLKDCGVTVLENEKVQLERNGAQITLTGVMDPAFSEESLSAGEAAVMQDQLSALQDEGDGYTLLLSHRPEFFDIYVSSGVNLVFAGHAHGGQWRIPGIGGLIAPGQGFFPAYTEGVHSAGQTAMVVSRGLGNSLMPLRIGNRPELVTVYLLAGS